MAEQALISTQARAVVMPWREDLARLAPHAREMNWDGARRLVLPHDVDNARFLRHWGVEIPSPILHYYDWRGARPWDIQIKTAAMLSTSPRAYCLNQMRTGKTRTVLWTLDYLMSVGAVRRALIVAPLSTLNIVWGQEILLGFLGRTYKILHGDKAKRLKRLAEPADFYVINHDGAEVIIDELMARQDIDAVVFDEVAVYRNSRSKRWRQAERLTRNRRYVWGLTGKPTPNEPTDAYGVGKLITPARVPKYFNQFRERTMMRLSQFKWAPKREAMDVVFDVLKPSVRFTRADVASSVPTLHLDRECEMSVVAKQTMETLIKKFRVLRDEGSITAANAGVLLNKLMQVACGWVYDDNHMIYDVSSPSRLQALDDILQETDKKVLVFVPYVHVVEGVAKWLSDKGYEVCHVYGDTSTRERDQIFSQFQNTSRYDVMVAHPQCMAHGLILTAADVAVWFGAPPSNEIYSQANDRIALPGLDYQTAIIHLTGSATERRRYNGLRKQEKLQDTLLAMLEDAS